MSDEENNLPPLPPTPPPAIGMVGQIPSFSSGNAEDWEFFKIKLKYFFLANNIVDPERKKAILFTAPGDYILRQAIKLCKPNDTEGLTYDETIELLDAHITPRPNRIVSQNTFRMRVQRPGESSKDFLAELRLLAEPCQFGVGLNDFLLSQFTLGLSDNALKVSLMRQDDLDLQLALAKAVASESANASLTQLQAPFGVSTQPVHKATAYRHHLKGGPDPSQKPSYEVSRSSNTPLGSQRCPCCNGDHLRVNCRFKNTVCYYCKTRGHIKAACRKFAAGVPVAGRTNEKTHLVTEAAEDDEPAPSDNVDWHLNYTAVESTLNVNALSSPPPFMKLVRIENELLRMEVDSGSGVSLIGIDNYHAKFSHLVLQNPDLDLKTWSEERLPVLGKIMVMVSAIPGVAPTRLPLMVMRTSGQPLLGRQWFAAAGIRIVGASQQQHVLTTTSTKVASSVHGLPTELGEFSHLFTPGLGCFKGAPAQVFLKHGAQPIFRRARSVPLALVSRVSAELDRMVQRGTLEPVATSEWASPTVNVIKPDGSIRICGDYSATVNPVASREIYPLPSVQEILSKLSGGKIFAKLDLSEAYLQVPVDEEASHILTLNTHRGLFKVNRLPPGFTSATAIFQRKMEITLAGLNAICYLDDLLLKADSRRELFSLVGEVLARFHAAGLKLRLDKCLFGVFELEFVGYHISATGISPSKSKVEPLFEARSPANLEELEVYLGFINYYDRFFPHKANELQPLYQLQQSDQPWRWTKVEEDCIAYVKRVLSSSIVLRHYSSSEPVVLACDAAPHGVGAVLSHVNSEGEENPVMYASRSLKPAEKNYSQLDKEALSIIFAVKKLNMFLAGRRFQIFTDHQPLLGIFKPNKTIPENLSPRLLRWCLIMSNYDYELVFRPGKKHANADFFSRFPCPSTADNIEEEKKSGVFLIDASDSSSELSAASLAKATSADPMLSEVRNGLLRGWSPTDMATEHARKMLMAPPGTYSVLRGVIVRGARVVVPQSLQAAVLSKLHEVHQGVVRTKEVARSYVHWPGIDNDIERLVLSCAVCNENRPSPPKSSVIPWSVPYKPWSRLHLDFAGPTQGHSFIVAVDAGSKWVDAEETRGSFSGATAVNFCRKLFATHGLPDELVCDNGPAFRSVEFMEFLKGNNIRQIFSAPYNPSSNGQAERTVRTLKSLLLKLPAQDWRRMLPNILLTLRVTPSTVTGLSPAEMLMGRKLTTVLTKLHPSNSPETRATQREQLATDVVPGPRNFSCGDPVYYRQYGTNKRWAPGVISVVEGPRNFVVTTADGRSEHRHLDQLHRRVLAKPNDCIVFQERLPLSTNVPELPDTHVPQGTLDLADSAAQSVPSSNDELAPVSSDHSMEPTQPLSSSAQFRSTASTSLTSPRRATEENTAPRTDSPTYPRRSHRVKKSVFEGSLKDFVRL